MSTPAGPLGTPGDCPICGSPERAPASMSLEATSGSVAVLAEGLGVRRCPRGHVDVPPEVIAGARRAITEALPVARHRRLRADACSSCGATMAMPVRRTVRAVTVRTAGTPIATLRFDLPMQRCGDCGLDQVPSRAAGDLSGAPDALVSVATTGG